MRSTMLRKVRFTGLQLDIMSDLSEKWVENPVLRFPALRGTMYIPQSRRAT
jgi:hypothetical protein